MQTKIKGLGRWSLALASGTGLLLSPLSAAIASEETEITGFYENATYVRDSAGLSKFRNTVQINAEREFGELGIFSNVS